MVETISAVVPGTAPVIPPLGPEHWQLLLPFLVVFLGACVALVVSVFPIFSPSISVPVLSALTLAAGAYLFAGNLGSAPSEILSSMVLVDSFGNIFGTLFCVVGALVILTSWKYLREEALDYSEYYILVMLSVLGMMVMATTLNLVVLFIALELMSVSVYVLVGFRRLDRKSNEAAMKYFILGSAASAVLLYGVALIYGATGSVHLGEIAFRVNNHAFDLSPLLVVGSVLVITGFFFKAAAAPFHVWMPDVYQGAPTPVTGFMTTGLKAAVFAAFIRFMASLNFDLQGAESFQHVIQTILWWTAAATMIAGNLVALLQTNIKRMLAYSSIAHTGYLLIGILSGFIHPGPGQTAVVFYLIVYCLMNLGAFIVLSRLGGRWDAQTELSDFSGLSSRSPLMALVMTVFLFSMAGVPPTGGFMSKYYLFYGGVQTGSVGLVVLGVLTSAVAAFTYLRIVVFMYMIPAPSGGRNVQVVAEPLTTVILVLLALAVVQLGIMPGMIQLSSLLAN